MRLGELGVDQNLRAQVLEAAREARADAGRPQRRPAGVARRLGPAREEPPAHLQPVRPVSRPPDLAPPHAGISPPPAAWCSTSAASKGNGWSSAWKAASWARLGDGAKALENIIYAVAELHDRQSVFDLLERDAGGRRVRHDGGDRRDAAAVARGRRWTCCRPFPRPGVPAAFRGFGPGAISRSISSGTTGRCNEPESCRSTDRPAACDRGRRCGSRRAVGSCHRLVPVPG